MEQKEFYGSLESRKLTFFSVQLDEGLFCRNLDHSGKWTLLYHFSEMQTRNSSFSHMNKKHTQMTASAVEGGAHFLIWLLLKNTLCVCVF